MKIHDVALQHGNNVAARMMISKHLFNRYHLKIEDFADIAELPGWIAEMELLIGIGINQGIMPKEKILALCKTIVNHKSVTNKAMI